MSAINNVKFQQFLKQARGVQVLELHVSRQDRRKDVLLRYNGKGTGKQGKALVGEWTIARGEKDEAALEAEVQKFLELARKHFVVKRGEGLTDERYADAAQETKVAPIVAEKGEEKA